MQGMRGKALEKAVKKIFEIYESRGIHCQTNHPEQLFDGTMVKRHGFDFQVFYQGKFYAFDAKECQLNNFPIDKIKLHQLKALSIVESNGGEAFFLVYFSKTKKIVKFSPKMVQKKLIDKAKHISISDGEETSINLLGIK